MNSSLVKPNQNRKTAKWVWGYRKIYHNLFIKISPRILCNSLKKSGTHLLVGAVSGLDQFRQYGRKSYWHYLNRARVRPEKKPSLPKVIDQLSQCLPGEIFRGHIAAHQELAEFFSRGTFKHFFIYRDLRDVVISHFFGLKTREVIDTWPNRYFKSLTSDDERSTFLIQGLSEESPSDKIPDDVEYPNIGERFRENLAWLQNSNCLAL